MVIAPLRWMMLALCASLWVVGQPPPEAQQNPSVQLQVAEASVQRAARALQVTAREDHHLTPDVEREQTALLRDSLVRYVVTFRAARRTAAGSEQDLGTALRALYDPWRDWGAVSNTPHVISASLGKRRYLLVSWLLFRGGTGIPESNGFIQAFADAEGSLAPLTSTGGEFDGDGLVVRELSSPNPTEVWLLVSGQRLGDTGSRSDVAIYAFDGARFTTRWLRRDLPLLRVTVDGVLMRLDYSRKRGPGDPKTGFVFESYFEEYRISRKGVELVRGPIKQ